MPPLLRRRSSPPRSSRTRRSTPPPTSARNRARAPRARASVRGRAGRSRWQSARGQSGCGGRASAQAYSAARQLPRRPSDERLNGRNRASLRSCGVWFVPAVEQGTNGLGEVVAAERLLEEECIRVHERLLVVAGDEEHMPRLELPCE